MAALVPNATVAAGGWTDQAGGNTNLHDPLADENEDSYDVSPAKPNNAVLKVGLTDASPGTGDVFLFVDAVQVLG